LTKSYPARRLPSNTSLLKLRNIRIFSSSGTHQRGNATFFVRASRDSLRAHTGRQAVVPRGGLVSEPNETHGLHYSNPVAHRMVPEAIPYLHPAMGHLRLSYPLPCDTAANQSFEFHMGNNHFVRRISI
jgi:hypothetical protein